VEEEQSVLVSAISACADAKMLEMGEKIRVFVEQHHLGVYSTLVNMYTKCGKPEKAITLWKKIKTMKISGSHVYTTALSACTDETFLDVGKEVHQHIPETMLFSDIVIINSIMRMYVRCGAPKLVIEVWKEITQKHVRPNAITFNTAITACKLANLPDLGREIHDILRESGEQNDMVIGSLISMYVTCGFPQEAIGAWKGAINIDKRGDFSSSITYLSLLKACADAKNLVVGEQVYKTIKDRGIDVDTSLSNALMIMFNTCGKAQ